MARHVTNPAQHARVGELVDKLRGYPHEAHVRGRRCPPAPFGNTVRYAVPVPDPDLPVPPDPAPDNRPRVYIVADAVRAQVATAATLTPAERAELGVILDAGRVVPENAAMPDGASARGGR